MSMKCNLFGKENKKKQDFLHGRKNLGRTKVSFKLCFTMSYSMPKTSIEGKMKHDFLHQEK